MPCYIDTIVKISQVRHSDKEESNLTVVWRDINSQSVFVKNEYYSVGGKVIPGNYNDNLRLEDVAQKVNEENAMVRVLVKDYVDQSNSFIIRIVFPYNNNQFKYLMNSVHPDESLMFVIGLMEIIQDDLYVYAIETSYVDFAFQDANGNSFKEFATESYSKCRESNQFITESPASSSHSSKYVRVEDEDPNHIDSDYVEDKCEYDKGYTKSAESDENVIDISKKSGRSYEKANKGEINCSIVHNMRKRSEMLKNMNDNAVGEEYKKTN
ncbi:9571_t:CDS:2 [Cetraspora pellucida]|uniref:9571_t:CDS:1 n=1 Tax=Cetraspora pellucida TaxID=1433469 RepID=A0A9N9NP00_9GLOM|nr:9571_t:CDS:2 [Cetraspora pellucida]